MGSVPGQPFTPAGQLVTSGQMQAIEGAIKFLLNPPTCQALASATQNLAASTWTAISLDTEVYDSDGMHSATTNPSRFTAQTPGRYLVYGNVNYGTPGASATIEMQIRLNGGNMEANNTGTGNSNSGTVTQQLVVETYMNAGDYIELWGHCSVATTTSTTAGWTSSMSARWVAGS